MKFSFRSFGCEAVEVQGFSVEAMVCLPRWAYRKLRLKGLGLRVYPNSCVV